jgi:hypothetical protein
MHELAATATAAAMHVLALRHQLFSWHSNCGSCVALRDAPEVNLSDDGRSLAPAAQDEYS